MKIVQLTTCLLAMCLTFATAEERKAIAVLTTPNGTDVQGNITFVQAEEGSEVHITGVITGLSPGQHGFHVHEKGDLTGGCGSTGGHFNPENKNHGGPKDHERHVGDLGQIQADANQVATVDIHDNVISLYGAHSILGRAVVIHAGPDDMGKGGTDESRRTGSAGARLACGVIGIQHPITPWIESAAAPTEAGVTFIIAALLAASLITLV